MPAFFWIPHLILLFPVFPKHTGKHLARLRSVRPNSSGTLSVTKWVEKRRTPLFPLSDSCPLYQKARGLHFMRGRQVYFLEANVGEGAVPAALRSDGTKMSGRMMAQREVTPFTRFRKKGRLPMVWPIMPGQVFFVRWATKDRAKPLMAMRVVSQKVGCMNRWKADQKMP